MNFLHHRQKSQNHVLPMPKGLTELMADISREVLRCQPSIHCTYKFIADYLDAMLRTREKSTMAMEIIEEAILKTDEVYSEFVKCNIPKDKTDSFLDIMEITFRRFVEQKRKLNQDPRFITFHADDLLDELMRKCDLTKVEILRSRPAIQWAYKKFVETYLSAVEGTLDTEALYFDSEKLVASVKELQNLHESALKIQKLFRGYHTRNSLRKRGILKLKKIRSSLSFEDYSSTKYNTAATKIQATFKGFRVRKKKVRYLLTIEANRARSFEDFLSENQDGTGRVEITIQKEQAQVSTDTDEENIKTIHEQPEKDVPPTIIENLEAEAMSSFETFLSENKEEVLSKAAVTIQASFKGFSTRKKTSLALHEVSTEKSKQQTAPVQAEAEQTVPEHAEPEQMAPEQTELEHVEPEQTAPDQAEPEHVEPEHAVPEQMAPEQAASEHAEPEQTPPEQSEPEHAEPEQAASEHAEPKHAEPEHTEPEQMAPEQAASEHAEPEQTPPEQSEPEHAEPEQAASEHAEPKHAEPEHTEPEQMAPEQAASEQAASEHAEPEQTPPEQSEPERAEPEQAASEHAEPEHAGPEHAEPEQAASEQAESSNVENITKEVTTTTTTVETSDGVTTTTTEEKTTIEIGDGVTTTTTEHTEQTTEITEQTLDTNEIIRDIESAINTETAVDKPHQDLPPEE